MDVDQCRAAAAQFAKGLSCYNDDLQAAAVEWWRKAVLTQLTKATRTRSTSSDSAIMKKEPQSTGSPPSSGSARPRTKVTLVHSTASGARITTATVFPSTRPPLSSGSARPTIGLLCADRDDHTAAVVWFRRAADQGHANAQYNLGCAYYTGHGVPVDHDAGVEWWSKAVLTQRSWATQKRST
jgi:TPR repeat protein